MKIKEEDINNSKGINLDSIYEENKFGELSLKRTYHEKRAKEIEEKHDDSCIYISNSRIGINNTKIVGNNNNIQGKKNVIIGHYNKLTGHSSIVDGMFNECNGNHNTIVGNNNRIRGHTNEIYGDENTVIGKCNKTVGNSNKKYINTQEEEKCMKIHDEEMKKQENVVVEIPKEEEESIIKDENVPDELICVVCAERKINTVILDCRHSKLCIHCSRTIMSSNKNKKKCPICRKIIEKGIIKIF